VHPCRSTRLQKLLREAQRGKRKRKRRVQAEEIFYLDMCLNPQAQAVCIMHRNYLDRQEKEQEPAERRGRHHGDDDGGGEDL
jgi:hypothetical protein